MRYYLCFFMGFLLAIFATFAIADDAANWVGKKVMVIHSDAKLEESGKSLSTAVYIDQVFTVSKVNGDWLWVGRGWIHKTDVVPYEQAIAYFTRRIQEDPSDGGRYGDRAGAYQALGELDKAIADMTECIRLSSGDDENLAVDYYNRGLIWYDKGEYDIAIRDYSEAIRHNPNYGAAYSARGTVWKEKENYDKALADFNQALRLDPKDVEALDYRGNAWESKGSYEKALADYNQAIRLDPKYPWAYYDRAWIWATCPDPKFRDGVRAVESATRACELNNWQDPGPIDTLAAAYAEKGDFDSAVRWETKALELLPNDSTFQEFYKARLEMYKAGKPYRQEPKGRQPIEQVSAPGVIEIR